VLGAEDVLAQFGRCFHRIGRCLQRRSVFEVHASAGASRRFDVFSVHRPTSDQKFADLEAADRELG
jgi:hypothetical protein